MRGIHASFDRKNAKDRFFQLFSSNLTRSKQLTSDIKVGLQALRGRRIEIHHHIHIRVRELFEKIAPSLLLKHKLIRFFPEHLFIIRKKYGSAHVIRNHHDLFPVRSKFFSEPCDATGGESEWSR